MNQVMRKHRAPATKPFHSAARKILPLALILLALVVFADELVKISIQEYKKRRNRSTTEEAYQRALHRLRETKIGMKTDLFFEKMEMLMIRDKEGRAIDGFVDGYLQAESVDMSEGKDPDRYAVFGYHTKWKKKKGAVKKFYVVFRHKILREIAFFDPKDDIFGCAAKAEGE